MTWHTGRTVGRTIYKGDGPDDLIGIMDTRELATLVVDAVNRRPDLVERHELIDAAAQVLHDLGSVGHGGKHIDRLRAAVLRAMGGTGG